MAMDIIGGVTGFGIGLGMQAAGPWIQDGLSQVELKLGLNTVGRGRELLYRANRQTTLDPTGASEFFTAEGRNFTPLKFNFAQALKFYNQRPHHFGYENQDRAREFWQRMALDMRYNGVSLYYLGQPIDQATNDQKAWQRLIDMSCAGAPLEQVIRDFYRSEPMIDANKLVDTDELLYNLQRAEFRRKADRERVLKPSRHWSINEIQQLWWAGLLKEPEYFALLKASGYIIDDDQNFGRILAQRRPEMPSLVAWASRRLWDQDIADTYGLDSGFDQSPVAKFFGKAQGWGTNQIRLPDQPDGEADWLKLAYRATRPLPDFSTARTLQHRLRPAGEDPFASVVPGVGQWGERDTRSMLQAQGFSDVIIDRLMGLVTEPINIRIIHTLLLEVLKHDQIKQKAAEAFGADVDWIKGSFLDHGFSDAISELAADALRAQAEDALNREREEHEKRARQDSRDVALSEYKAGIIGADDAVGKMTDKFFSANMAQDALYLEDRKINLEIIERQVAALKSAWMHGTFSAVQIDTALQGLGIGDVKRTIYEREWTWERTEKVQILSTGEILKAMREGMLSPADAQVRLLNLGWSLPDALIEIALIEQEAGAAQAKMEAAQLNKATAEAARTAKEKAKELADAAKEAVARAKEERRLSYEQAAAVHQKLLQESTYYVNLHKTNEKYNKASAKKNQEAMDAAIYEQIADYQRWLAQQIKLASPSPEVASAVEPITTEPAPSAIPGPIVPIAPS